MMSKIAMAIVLVLGLVVIMVGSISAAQAYEALSDTEAAKIVGACVNNHKWCESDGPCCNVACANIEDPDWESKKATCFQSDVWYTKCGGLHLYGYCTDGICWRCAQWRWYTGQYCGGTSEWGAYHGKAAGCDGNHATTPPCD